jgi:hypothetical protein
VVYGPDAAVPGCSRPYYPANCPAEMHRSPAFPSLVFPAEGTYLRHALRRAGPDAQYAANTSSGITTRELAGNLAMGILSAPATTTLVYHGRRPGALMKPALYGSNVPILADDVALHSILTGKTANRLGRAGIATIGQLTVGRTAAARAG